MASNFQINADRLEDSNHLKRIKGFENEGG
jgi:hypothetical protein